MQKPIMDLTNLMEGAANERFQMAAKEIAANIADVNTDAKFKRSITLKVEFKPNEQRNVAEISVSCDVKLAPAEKLETTAILESNSETGELGIFELGVGLKPDQHTLPIGVEIESVGIVPPNPKVSALRKAQ